MNLDQCFLATILKELNDNCYIGKTNAAEKQKPHFYKAVFLFLAYSLRKKGKFYKINVNECLQKLYISECYM